MSEEVIEKKEFTKKINKKESSEDPHAKLTLFVRGLPFDATSKDLEDFFGDIGPIRKCFVVTDRVTDEEKAEKKVPLKNKGFGYVHYALEEDAQAALNKLKHVKFMGRKLNIELAKRRSETTVREDRRKPVEPVVPVEKVEPKKPAEPLNFDVNARLIVRNLPWKYREADLKKLFEAFGNVHDLKLPRKYEGGPLRGFAFIQFEKVDDAKAAMEAMNATEHAGRTIAVDWSIPKGKYREIEEKEAAVTQAAVPESEDSEMKEASEESSEESSDEEEEDKEDNDDEENDSDNDENDDSENDDSENEDGDNEEDVKARKAKKMTGPTSADGTTLFIRNLLFESTEEDLKELFKQWGSVLYAKITRDPVTKLSRGTGFVCMRKKEDVDEILEAAERLRTISQKDENNDTEAMNQLLSKREKKKKGLMYKSIITPESGSGDGAKFTLHGRVLEVTLAVDRTQAKEIKDANLSQKRKEDKRNLYLMREGVVFPNTPAAETMTPAELSKRQLSFSSRKKLISSNPALYISRTRLSIRNLPIKVTDTDLRALGMSSINKFKNQVKAGERTDLTKEEKEDGWHLLPRVKQAKIIRSKDRIDTATNELRSKGYGFLEFSTHSHALASLRYLNNNPDIFEGKRLIVEFSLENKDVTDRREQRTEGGRPDAKRGFEGGHGDDDSKRQRTDGPSGRGGFGGDRGGRGGFGGDRGGRGGFGGDRGGRGGFGGDRGDRGDRGSFGGDRGGRGGSRGSFGGDRGGRGGSRGGRGGFGGDRGGRGGDRDGGRGGFGGGRGGSRGGRGGSRGGRGGSRGGRD
ncbi:hypothetical protein INT48_002141 [Thamnidium elegans]|uniref:RRM domain-containing protein n=1 Tax=Thamnidium elegans TaxID=101142 RepID=A0A8H7T0I2_9FUNG|nr:hypothetical protein INT48_002141 [Thamnidium elegans]